MYDAKCSDELWLAVKSQSNTEIAGSPRNIFRYSAVYKDGGRATGRRSGTQVYCLLPNSEYHPFSTVVSSPGANSGYERETTQIVS